MTCTWERRQKPNKYAADYKKAKRAQQKAKWLNLKGFQKQCQRHSSSDQNDLTCTREKTEGGCLPPDSSHEYVIKQTRFRIHHSSGLSYDKHAITARRARAPPLRTLLALCDSVIVTGSEEVLVDRYVPYFAKNPLGDSPKIIICTASQAGTANSNLGIHPIVMIEGICPLSSLKRRCHLHISRVRRAQRGSLSPRWHRRPHRSRRALVK